MVGGVPFGNSGVEPNPAMSKAMTLRLRSCAERLASAASQAPGAASPIQRIRNLRFVMREAMGNRDDEVPDNQHRYPWPSASAASVHAQLTSEEGET
jgi:hypothetical protein